MKKLLPLLCLLFVVTLLRAQQVKYNADGSYYKKCARMYTSRPLRDLINEHNANAKKTGKITPHPSADEASHEAVHKLKTNPTNRVEQNPSLIDGAWQSQNGTVTQPGPIVNIQGQQSLQGAYPLDPNGMVGSNYYVQTVNVNYAVYNKSGSVVLAATDLVNLFAGSSDIGDAVAHYDKAADRWMITELDGSFSTFQIDTLLFAISTTNDPTGSYYVYAFCPDNTDIADYPKFVVWDDGYYCTCNCEPNDYVIAFQRDSMLAGSPNAGYIAMPFNDNPLDFGSAGSFFCPMMLDCDGTLPPYGSPEFLFYFWDDNWGAGGNDEICIDKISVDWSNQSGTITHYDTLRTALFNSFFAGPGTGIIPQPGNNSGDYMQSLDGYFAYRVPYLRWASYNSAVMCTPVNVGGNTPVAGVRWYELHQDTTTKAWSIYQQSTYAPNDRIDRWNPSIAMDQNGDIGLAYSVSDSASVYPGLRYTGRRVCDPLNTMPVKEITACNGNALTHTQQGNNGGRWGDYSQMAVDPVNGITFWHTNMYSLSGAGFGANVTTRIFSFQIGGACTQGIADITNTDETSVVAHQNGGMLHVKGINFPENERLVIQLFDMNGKTLMQQEKVTNTGTLETYFNVSDLAKGIYIVRIANDQIQRVVKTAIN